MNFVFGNSPGVSAVIGNWGKQIILHNLKKDHLKTAYHQIVTFFDTILRDSFSRVGLEFLS